MSTPSAGSSSDAPPFRYTAALADTIELRWQRAWDEGGVYRAANPGEPGFHASRPKFYCLDMFPYPSGAGLHVGHPEGYTATDILCRYKRMQGFNVLHPMGWDAFGLPAEQYAIQTGVHPALTTRKAIDNFRRQLKRFGFSYDWSREFATIDEGYYRWTQWIFLQVYNAWFDAEAGQRPEVRASTGRGRARPIAELVAELEAGAMGVSVTGEPVRLGERGVTGPLGGTPVGVRMWHQLSQAERRRFIDSQRLAFLDEVTVNWCPKLGTTLANEEVIDGRSERGGHPVYRKPLKQWMFRITAYAERLLEGLRDVDWPESTRTLQTEWIGRSEGAEVDFVVLSPSEVARTSGPGGSGGPGETALTGGAADADASAGVGAFAKVRAAEILRVYTTRPDTIFGATYMVVAPEHDLIKAVLGAGAAGEHDAALRRYVEWARNRSDVERMESKEKTGAFTGVFAINPATGRPIPVWTADYVLMGYGTGAIMGVPAQDERDWAFAKTFHLPIVRTVRPPEGWGDEPYTGDGPAMNSANTEVSLDGLGVAQAKSRVIDWLESRGLGARKVNYKLRDWVFSRQRYWGEPFPIVYDEAGNHYGVGEAALPVRLPELADYQPIESDEPRPLLAKARDWMHTTAGAAGVPADQLDPNAPVVRETNTMPGWAGSCWYYLRYCDPANAERFVGPEAERYWMGVDLYVGGAEHAVLHLLYARFWHAVLYDLGHVSTPEPFGKLFHQGLITSFAYQRPDKTLVPSDEVETRVSADGTATHVERATGVELRQVEAKMSKSLKNVVNPDDVIAEYGADTFRLYEMYMGPLDASKPWNPRDIAGCFRFVQRAWRLCVDERTGALKAVTDDAEDGALERLLHRTIAKVQGDIERLAFNTAIAAMIEFVNAATSVGSARDNGAGTAAVLSRGQIERLACVLAPFIPHLAEELWAKSTHPGEGVERGFVAQARWPSFDPALLVDSTVEVPVQVLGKVKHKILVPRDADAAAMEAAARSDDKVRALLEGKQVKKVIVVPGKLINFVVG